MCETHRVSNTLNEDDDIPGDWKVEMQYSLDPPFCFQRPRYVKAHWLYLLQLIQELKPCFLQVNTVYFNMDIA